MNRRAFIGLVGVALTTGLAGCVGSGNDSSDLKSTGFNFAESEDGALVVEFGVTNESDEEVTETLTVNATINGEAYTESKEVTLAPGGEETFEFEFDVPYDEAMSGDFEIRGEIGE